MISRIGVCLALVSARPAEDKLCKQQPSCHKSTLVRSLGLDNLGAVGGRQLLQRMGVIEALLLWLCWGA